MSSSPGVPQYFEALSWGDSRLVSPTESPKWDAIRFHQHHPITLKVERFAVTEEKGPAHHEGLAITTFPGGWRESRRQTTTGRCARGSRNNPGPHPRHSVCSTNRLTATPRSWLTNGPWALLTKCQRTTASPGRPPGVEGVMLAGQPPASMRHHRQGGPRAAASGDGASARWDELCLWAPPFSTPWLTRSGPFPTYWGAVTPWEAAAESSWE